MTRFSGTGTALITPFRNGEVDYGSLERMIAFQIEGGVDFLVVLGTTGEAPAVTMREREEIVRFAVRTAGGRVPVVVGTGSNSTVPALELARQAVSSGADGLLVVTPYYNTPPQEGLYDGRKAPAQERRRGRGQARRHRHHPPGYVHDSRHLHPVSAGYAGADWRGQDCRPRQSNDCV